MSNNSNNFDQIPVGTSTVSLDSDSWEKHGRMNTIVFILPTDDPYSDYDSLRNDVTIKETKEAIDWIIENENRDKLKNYTSEQIKFLHQQIQSLINKH